MTSVLWAVLAAVAFALPASGQAPAPGQQPVADRTFLYRGEATSILGRKVLGPGGDVVGRIVDVLVGDGGMPRAAVIDFGGFMGVGNRRGAVTWSSLSFDGATKSIALDMTANQIRAIPQFRLPDKPADPPVSVAVPPVPKAPPAPR